jgi:hypothetical protein
MPLLFISGFSLKVNKRYTMADLQLPIFNKLAARHQLFAGM